MDRKYTYSKNYFEDEDMLPEELDNRQAKEVFFDRVSIWGDYISNVKSGLFEVDNPDTGLWNVLLRNGESIYTGNFNSYEYLKPYTGQAWKKDVIAFIYQDASVTWWWVENKESSIEAFVNYVDWFE